jgi:hypothetical protein
MILQLCSETKGQSSWGFKGSLFVSFHLSSDTRKDKLPSTANAQLRQ